MTKDATLIVVSVVAFALWLWAFVWSLRQPRESRRFHLFLLLAGSLLWWLSETLGIRAGKYQYAGLWALPLGGPVDFSDRAYLGLKWLLEFFGGHMGIEGCDPKQASWNIPAAVVALEATIVFGFFRMSTHLLAPRTASSPSWKSRILSALPTAGFIALLAVNLDAILDPAVSTSQWCGDEALNPNFREGTLGLWHWFTNDPHRGYWFGVPLINYIGWFLVPFAFGLVLRYFDEGPEELIKRCNANWLRNYLIALVVTIVALFAVQIPLKVVTDFVFVHLPTWLPLDVDLQIWQYGVIVALLGGGLLLTRRGQHRRTPTIEWISVGAQAAVFAICLALVLIEWHLPLFLVWAVTFAIAAAVTVGPWLKHRAERTRQADPQRGAGVGV
jgi:hypothetical protein